VIRLILNLYEVFYTYFSFFENIIIAIIIGCHYSCNDSFCQQFRSYIIVYAYIILYMWKINIIRFFVS